MAADSIDELLALVGSLYGSLFQETTIEDGAAHSSEVNRRHEHRLFARVQWGSPRRV
jgi:hypothetical protein